jgi:hypothetical protein
MRVDNVQKTMKINVTTDLRDSLLLFVLFYSQYIPSLWTFIITILFCVQWTIHIKPDHNYLSQSLVRQVSNTLPNNDFKLNYRTA